MSRIVYGVVRADSPALSVRGIGGSPVELVVEGDIAALVSEGPALVPARPSELAAHMAVLEEAMTHGPVLPFRFGTVADIDDDVRLMLRDRLPDFRRQLDEVDGAVQVTLRVTRDEDDAVRLAVSKDPGLRRYAQRSRPRATVMDLVNVGERVAQAVQAQNAADRAMIIDRVARCSVAVATGTDQMALADLALLVRRDRMDDLGAVVQQLKDQFGPSVTISYAGPMPAYSFVG